MARQMRTTSETNGVRPPPFMGDEPLPQPESAAASQKVTITPPKFVIAPVPIVGTAPYVQNRMSQRAREAMEEAQKAGTQQRALKRRRDPKDFDAAYRGAMHKSTEGWYGIPCAAFRTSMISACRTIGFPMTRAKLFIFIEPDGWDSEDGQPLVRLEGEPEPFNMAVRLPSGTTDIACRPKFKEWSATVRIKYDADSLTAADVVNLLARAGVHCGIGAGRPDSRETAGAGFGTFEIRQD